MSHFKRSLSILLILGAAGCGKDRTVEQYHAQLDNQKKHETQSIAGTFNGALISKLNGKAMGALSIAITGDTEIPDMDSPASSADARNIISADITLTTKTFSHTIFGAKGDYDPYSHAYEVDFEIAAGVIDSHDVPKAVPMRVFGKIDPVTKVMTGSLQCVNYPKYGGTLKLTRDGNSPQIDDTRLPTDRANSVLSRKYSARQIITGVEQIVTMKMAAPVRGVEQDFLDLFYPIRYTNVTVTLTETKYGDQVMSIPFQAAEWDMDSKMLNGSMSGAYGSQAYHFTLQCRESGTAKVPGWNCRWSGVAPFTFNAKAVQ